MLVVTAAAANRPPEGECVIAARWAKNHLHELPTSLAGLSKFRLTYRKAIYNALSHDAQLRLWHEQNAYYRDDANLTAEQRALVTEIDGVIDRYFSKDSIAIFDSLYKQRAMTVFGKKLAAEVIADLGINTPEQVAASVADRTFTPTTCECSTDSNWCAAFNPTSPFTYCNSTFSCDGTRGGCGTGWSYNCNGICTAQP